MLPIFETATPRPKGEKIPIPSKNGAKMCILNPR